MFIDYIIVRKNKIWIWIWIWIWNKTFIYTLISLKKNIERNKIIEDLYTSTEINSAISKMNPYELQDDLKQEVFLVLCELDEDRLFKMHSDGYLKYFIVRTILNMAKSDRSNFSRTFRKVFEEIDDNLIDELYDESLPIKLNKSYEVLHWYEKEIFRLYSENKNLLAISRQTDIPYRSLLKTIKKVKTFLKYKIRNNDID